MNKETLNSLFSQFDATLAEMEQIEAEAKAKLAEAASRRDAAIAAIAGEMGEVKSVVRNGKTLTPVLRTNADGTTMWFFRGLNEPKAKKNVVEL